MMHPRYSRFGYFGKGIPIMLPPPPPPKFPATYKSGKWDCSAHPKPPNEPEHYYHCCPSGWTKTAFNDTTPCKGKDGEKYICGPLPKGAKETDVTCCENMKKWVAGSDPGVCKQAAIQSGKAVPGVMETMLAQEVQAPEPVVSPVFLIVGGLAAVGLVVMTLLLR